MPLTISVTDPSALPRSEALALANLFYELAGVARRLDTSLATALQDHGAATVIGDGAGVTLSAIEPDATGEMCAGIGTMPAAPVVDTAAVFAAGGATPVVAAVPAPAVAVVSPTPPAPPAPPSTERDSAGLPWDGRIHSSKRTKIANGTWKLKRGVDDASAAAVLVELRAAMNAPVPSVVAAVPPAAPFPPPNPAFVTPAPAAPFPAAATLPPLVPITPPAAPVVAPPAPPAAFTAPVPGATPPAPPTTNQPITFPAMMARLTPAVQAKTVTHEMITAAIEAVGLPTLPALAARPDLVPTVAASLGL